VTEGIEMEVVEAVPKIDQRFNEKVFIQNNDFTEEASKVIAHLYCSSQANSYESEELLSD